jgi:hypothetical protein
MVAIKTTSIALDVQHTAGHIGAGMLFWFLRGNRAAE